MTFGECEMKFYNDFINRIHKPPNNLPDKNYQSWVLINYSCTMGGVVHFFFIFLFAIVGVVPLALLNIGSTVIWALSVYFNLKGFMKTSLVFANFEIVMHAWLCTIFIGWNTGFHYHILVMPAIIFLTPLTFKGRIIGYFINIILYSLLNYFFQAFSPLMTIDPMLSHVFNYTNISVFGFILAYFSFHYQTIVFKTEAKLEMEHQKTNDALVARNEILMRLNEELTEAADYVKSLLPKPITEGPIKTEWRFIPSASLGGDAFGYHWIDSNHFAIYLLDVSGHGVGAALLSVSVTNTLRSQSLPDIDFRDCKQVLESLNAKFPSEENNDMFFTIWYGVYNKNTRELTYSSGGHPPALLLIDNSEGDSEAVLLKTPNYVIGGMQEVTYEKQKFSVGEHTKLYVFSDGVYEVEKSDGSMWRFKEFIDFMNKVKTDGQSILDRLHRYAGNLRQSDNFEDDFTILEVGFT
jgi:sigma-B regulation protein RsbU (phosphoserine phosphatase)